MANETPGATAPGTPNPNQDPVKWLDWPKIFQSLLTAAILSLATGFWQLATENQRQNYQLQQHEQRWAAWEKTQDQQERDDREALRLLARLEQAVSDLSRRAP